MAPAIKERSKLLVFVASLCCVVGGLTAELMEDHIRRRLAKLDLEPDADRGG